MIIPFFIGLGLGVMAALGSVAMLIGYVEHTHQVEEKITKEKE